MGLLSLAVMECAQVIKGKPEMERSLDCPSSQPDQLGSRIIGVVVKGDGSPSIAFLKDPVPPEQIAHLVPDSVPVTEIVRIAAPCQQEKCRHFGDGKCSLVSKIVEQLPQVVQHLSYCPTRKSCLWWSQEGAEACRRCPQVVTEPFHPSESTRKLAPIPDPQECRVPKLEE
ncbi:hypothetical protein [Ralstonia pseudosolanacearum]|uniref:hypothetical protein n=1 Tax=Ralstonia pseudosolanacearum TaxID=1310165 RepID=UPI001E63AFF4|nr:hypothetical protein [Ralstonia pseudosolanacearum]